MAMAQKPKRQVKLNHLSQSRNGQITGAFFLWRQTVGKSDLDLTVLPHDLSIVSKANHPHASLNSMDWFKGTF